MLTDTVVKSILFGAGGVLVASIHWVSRAFGESADTSVLLCEKYVHLHKDSRLLQTLHKVDQDFVELDQVAAVRLILHIDQLLEIRFTLEQTHYQPLVSDRSRGLAQYQATKATLKRLTTSIGHICDPRRVISIQRHIQTITQCLDTHLQHIILSTRDINIYPL
jgi:hypothetical protein